jgi:succinate dehydrogenase/fumarate reductase cytochrome b subunit
MNLSTTVNSERFWERLWRSSGIIFVVFFVIAYVMYGLQPKVGASAETLVSFYDGQSTRILMATLMFGSAVLFLLWFAAAIRSTLHDTGQGGWGAATASSAALGGMLWALIAVGAALAYSIAGSGNDTLTSGLNDLVWVCIVVSSFPRAMLIMAGTFGLWRAKMISNALFWAGVAAVVLVLVGGMTWASNGIWAPDGAYSRFFSPLIGIVWILVFSRVLLTRRIPSTTPLAPEPPAAAAAP